MTILNRHRRSGILKHRENTIITAEAPSIILSDERLKAGRVSLFIHFRLFLSMTIRSIGIIFDAMSVLHFRFGFSWKEFVCFVFFLVEHVRCTS